MDQVVEHVNTSTGSTVDYEYVHHHEDGEPGPLVVRGVPAEACVDWVEVPAA